MIFAASGAAAAIWDMVLAYSATNRHSHIAAQFSAEVPANTDLEVVIHQGGALFGGGEIYGAVRCGAGALG
jgi:hypothetical protein